MKITKSLLKDDKACKDGMDWFKEHFPKGEEVNKVFETLLEENHFDWGNWWLSKQFTKSQSVLYSIFSAELCLEKFEKIYPNDNRPRKAIESAKKYLVDPSENNESAARSAAWSAESAARSAAWSAARSAESAARSAESAARSAESAAWSAESAAWSAESAAWSAEIQKKILDYGLWILGFKDL